MFGDLIIEEIVRKAVISTLEKIIVAVIKSSNTINIDTSSWNERARITKEAKDDLFYYFDSHGFHQNSKLPRYNSRGHEELDAIISSHRLERSQVARQLTSWKNKNSKLMLLF